MSNQPVLRLNQSGLSGKLHTKQELYPEPLCAASLGDDTANQLLDSCDFEEFAFNDVTELLDNDWTDPHTPLDSLLADSLPGIDDTSTYDSSQAGSWPASSSVATTFSAIGKDSVTSRNSELQEASTQLRLSRPSLRTTASTASHSPVPDTAAATFLSLYEETRAAYLKELRRLREFLLNSYKSAGKAPNADGQTKLSELEGLISFFQPRRHELEAYHLTPDGLQRLRHLRDVARAYVQFYRSMKPKRDQELQSHGHHAAYFDPQRMPPHPHHAAPLNLRPAAASSARAALHLSMPGDPGSAGSHPSLSKRAMLQTISATAPPPLDPPGTVPRLGAPALQRGSGGQRSRNDALKTMPVLAYGGSGLAAAQMQMHQQQQQQMEDMLAMQQLGVLPDEQELLQGLGSKGHSLDDLDLLGIPGLVPGANPADMQGWNELLDDCLQLPGQNPGPW